LHVCVSLVLFVFFDVPFFVHIQGVALGPLIEAPIKMDPLREKHAMNIHVCQVERNQQFIQLIVSCGHQRIKEELFSKFLQVVHRICMYLHYLFAACERLAARRVSSHCEAHVESGLTSVLHSHTRPL